jgi:ribosome biogenesis GTPase
VTDLSRLGYGPSFAAALAALSDLELLPARVVGVHRGGGCVLAGAIDGPALLRGRPDAGGAPVVGDWVAARRLGAQAIVEHILTRQGLVARKASGRSSAAQPIAANVDRLLAVTTAGADFSPRRVERYLAIAWDGGALPLVVLAKVDLVDEPGPFVRALAAVAPGVTVLAVSAATGAGMAELAAELGPGRTGALVGSSGVGKSTLVNALLGAPRQAVAPVRAADDKGRHTTTARELHLLPGGGLLVDTPGMRELGLAGGDAGLHAAFADVDELAAGCRFRDCAHAGEPGCAVAAALASGALAPARLAALRALAAEQAYEARRRDAGKARADKDRGRAISRALRARARLDPKLRED